MELGFVLHSLANLQYADSKNRIHDRFAKHETKSQLMSSSFDDKRECRVCLASFAVGNKEYVQNARYVIEHNWRPYAEKHGYEIRLFDEWLDTLKHHKSPMMQKMLVWDSLQEFDFVVYLDTDIVIHPHAPGFPVESVSPQCIAAVLGGEGDGVKHYYTEFSLSSACDRLVQGGVIGAWTKTAGARIAELYRLPVRPQTHPVHAPDQALLSVDFGEEDKIVWLDERWNYVPVELSEILPREIHMLPNRINRQLRSLCRNLPRAQRSMKEVLRKNYFVHFVSPIRDYLSDAIAYYKTIN